MHRHHWKVQKDGRRTLPPATLLHIEKTHWSPNCRIKTQGQGRSVQSFAGTRSSTLRPWVLSLTLTCLATQASASFSKGRLCRVRRRFPGSEALRCKGSGMSGNSQSPTVHKRCADSISSFVVIQRQKQNLCRCKRPMADGSNASGR